MAKDNLKTKFYKFIYLLDKENNKEEGKDTPDFDTWLKELKKEENNNLKKQKKLKKEDDIWTSYVITCKRYKK